MFLCQVNEDIIIVILHEFFFLFCSLKGQNKRINIE